MSKFLGNVSAYAYAKSKGYTGTEEEFAELMASYATVAEQAANSANTATTKATEAVNSANTATTKATEAATSATNAAGSATTASTKAGEAANSASTATTKAGEAAISAYTATTKATEAVNSANTATTKATEAATSATNAAESATTASTKATEAVNSANTANTKAGEAATSATNAANSANTANTKAGEAATSATNAAESATTASTKASEASTSATNAAESATTASTKATEAATSATNAANSANTATTKATEAATSATNASNSATSAAASAADAAQHTASAISDWLDGHPEATTTVEDGSITKAKLSNSLISELASSGADEQLGKFVNYYKDGIIPQLVNCTQTSTGLDPLVLTGTKSITATIKIPFEDFVSDYTSGDAYYFRFTIETSTDCTGFGVRDFRGASSSDVAGSSDLRPGPNNPVTFSFISTNYSGSADSLIIRPTISSGLSGVTITVSNIWLINLTKQFDLIPSLGQIDHLIDTGTEYLYSPKTYASTVPYLGVKNTLFDKRTGTISANAGSNGSLNWDVVGLSDYVSGVTKGYSAATFQVVGATQIATTGSYVREQSCIRYLTTDEITALNNGEWVTISMVNGRTGESDTKVSCKFLFTFVDNTITNKINWRNPIGINLTDAFGAGNEPSRESMDDILSLYADRRPPYEYSMLTTARSVVAKPRGIEGIVGNEQFVRTMPEGNVMMSSMPFSEWSGWSEIGTYGQTNVTAIPIYNKVHGTIETDGMVSVLPLWGCWSANASNTGGAHHGAHVFHGWTTDRQHRLTMAQNIYSDDEASIFNYIPGDKSNTSGGIFLPLRLGTDLLSNGLSLTPVYVDGAGFAFRAKLTGIMNLDYKYGVFPKPTSSSSSGTKGDICFDSDYIYVCVNTNSWKRVALSTWQG